MATRPLSASHSYTWSFPGAPVRVRLLLDVVRDVRSALSGAGSEDAPQRRGILLGTTGPVTEIAAAIPCTAPGADGIPAALSEVKPTGLLKPVGFYRCQPEERLSLNPQDLEIASRHFCHPGDVFLVIHTEGAETRLATFFFWDGTRIHAEFAFLEFPFDVEGLKVREGQRLAESAAGKKPAATPALAPVLDEPDPAPLQPAPLLPAALDKRQSPRDRRRLTVALLGIAGLLLAGALYLALRPAARARESVAKVEVTTPLGLQLRLLGADLSVSWDRDTVVRSGADAGVLTVRDGDKEKAYGLNREQLRSAHILISPESEQVQVQLSLVMPDQRALRDGAMALLAARQPVAPGAVRPPSARTGSGERPAPVARAESTRQPAEDPDIAPVRWTRAEPKPDGSASSLEGAERLARREPIEPAAANRVPLEERASLVPRGSSAPAGAPPAPVNAPGGGASASGSPAGGVQFAGQTQPAIGGGTSRQEPRTADLDVVPARFLSGKNPRYPAAALRNRVEGTVVVEATIGPEGEVRQLTVISGPALLREEAVNAVRSGKFTPARINGRAVTAPTRVEVNFHGKW